LGVSRGDLALVVGLLWVNDASDLGLLLVGCH
jgi:hypothetical protein